MAWPVTSPSPADTQTQPAGTPGGSFTATLIWRGWRLGSQWWEWAAQGGEALASVLRFSRVRLLHPRLLIRIRTLNEQLADDLHHG
jgi:hypothetical protein